MKRQKNDCKTRYPSYDKKKKKNNCKVNSKLYTLDNFFGGIVL